MVRVATFNVENLFARFRFERGVVPADAVRDGWSADQTRFSLMDAQAKAVTAQALLALDADVVALQEVEGLDTLKRFREQFLGGRLAYPHAAVLDGNDPRLIDVALLSRHPIVHLRSWQHLWDEREDAPVFTRDCLEADVEVPGHGRLTLFVNHFKSMQAPQGGDPARGRALTRPRREGQARAVRAIVEERFGSSPGEHPFVVLGDLNDYPEADEQGPSALLPLLEWDGAVENVLARLPEGERWTHHWKGDARAGRPDGYRQLDYLLVSRLLASRSPALPLLERRGLPLRARGYAGPRFPGVGRDFPKASDHCALAFDLEPWAAG
jgi:endonuclease/exonuclease/phosphatase family metal-dependent hydrolase